MKEETIEKLQIVLTNGIETIRKNEKTTSEDKIIQISVLLDTMKFLQDYDENVKVLNEHLINKKNSERNR